MDVKANWRLHVAGHALLCVLYIHVYMFADCCVDVYHKCGKASSFSTCSYFSVSVFGVLIVLLAL